MIILNFEPLSLNIDFCIKVWYNRITAEGCLHKQLNHPDHQSKGEIPKFGGFLLLTMIS